jgi:hypothetical protein
VGQNGYRLPVCLDDVRLRGAKYVTLSSDWSNQGKFYNLGSITYLSAEDNQKHTVDNVIGYVHDWGRAFSGRPDKIDVCTTICKNCTSDAQAGAYASGRNVGYIPSGQGAPDYNNASMFANSGWYDTLRAVSGQPAAPMTSPFAQTSPVPISQTLTQQTPASQISPSQISSSQTGNSNSILAALYQATTSPNALGPHGPSVAGILVQPHSVPNGSALIVSWTSVNMSQSSTCNVLVNGQAWTQSNEGSKNYQTSPANIGTLAFSIQCTDSAGNSYQASDSAIVQ